MRRLIVSLLVIGFCLFTSNVFAEGIDENTVLMLHCNGADGSQVFEDSSSSGHVVTAHGDAQIDVSQFQFGDASGLFNGATDYLTIPPSPDWNIVASLTDDWTIDFWVKHNVTEESQVYITQRAGWNDQWTLAHRNGIKFQAESGGVDYVETNYGGAINDNNWHHIALIKVGPSWGIYLDGTQVAYDEQTQTYAWTSGLGLGREIVVDRSNYFNGYMDEIRIQHSNYFGAAPASDFSDSIIMPTAEYSEYSGPNDLPIADAGLDVEASVGEEIILDASASYDPDGEIVSWLWKSLSDPENPVVASGEVATMNAHGLAEELIELTVTDDRGDTATDTLVVTNPGIEGPPGEPGIPPEEVAEILVQLEELQNLTTSQQTEIENIQSQQQAQEGRVTILETLQSSLDNLVNVIAAFPPIRNWLDRQGITLR